MTQVSAYMSDDRALVLLHIAPDQCPVLPFYGMVKKLLGKEPHSFVGFGKHQQSTGIFIDAVHQPETWKGGFVDRSILMLEVPGHPIKQRACVVSASGMHHH